MLKRTLQQILLLLSWEESVFASLEVCFYLLAFFLCLGKSLDFPTYDSARGKLWKWLKYLPTHNESNTPNMYHRKFVCVHALSCVEIVSYLLVFPTTPKLESWDLSKNLHCRNFGEITFTQKVNHCKCLRVIYKHVNASQIVKGGVRCLWRTKFIDYWSSLVALGVNCESRCNLFRPHLSTINQTKKMCLISYKM